VIHFTVGRYHGSNFVVVLSKTRMTSYSNMQSEIMFCLRSGWNSTTRKKKLRLDSPPGGKTPGETELSVSTLKDL
jgi:hypothetical protein